METCGQGCPSGMPNPMSRQQHMAAGGLAVCPQAAPPDAAAANHGSRCDFEGALDGRGDPPGAVSAGCFSGLWIV